MFSVFSEAACDLCNDLTDLNEWHPSICRSPLQDMMGEINRLDDSVPFHPGRPLAVDVEKKPRGFHDVYLDDMVQLFIDNDDNIQRAPSIIPLVLHLLVRPLADDEPIHRTAILAEDKVKAEGAPSDPGSVLASLVASVSVANTSAAGAAVRPSPIVVRLLSLLTSLRIALLRLWSDYFLF